MRMQSRHCHWRRGCSLCSAATWPCAGMTKQVEIPSLKSLLSMHACMHAAGLGASTGAMQQSYICAACGCRGDLRAAVLPCA